MSIAKYFRDQDKIVKSILKAHLLREPLDSDFKKTETIKKLDSVVSEVRYQKILIGKFANTL